MGIFKTGLIGLAATLVIGVVIGLCYLFIALMYAFVILCVVGVAWFIIYVLPWILLIAIVYWGGKSLIKKIRG
jgi:ABC-type arginine transport system permease subunit